MTQPNGAPQYDPVAEALAQRFASMGPEELARYMHTRTMLGNVATGANLDPNVGAPAPASADPNAPILPGFNTVPTIPDGGLQPTFLGGNQTPQPQPAPGNVQPKPTDAEKAAAKEAYNEKVGEWAQAAGNVYFFDPDKVKVGKDNEPDWVPTEAGEKMNKNINDRHVLPRVNWKDSQLLKTGNNKNGEVTLTKMPTEYASDYTGADEPPKKEKPGVVVFSYAVDGRQVEHEGEKAVFSCGWQIVLDKKQAKQFEQFLKDNPTAATDVMKRMVKDNFAAEDKKVWDTVKPKFKEVGEPNITEAEPVEPVKTAGPIEVKFGENPSYAELNDAATRAAREAALTHELGQKYKLPLAAAQEIAKYAMVRIGRNLNDEQQLKAEKIIDKLAQKRFKDINAAVSKMQAAHAGNAPWSFDKTPLADKLLVAMLHKNGVAPEDMGKFGVTYETMRELNKRNSKLGAIMEQYGLWQTPARRVGRIALWRTRHNQLNSPITPAEQNEGLDIFSPKTEVDPREVRETVVNYLHKTRGMPIVDAEVIGAYAAARNSGFATPEELHDLSNNVASMISKNYLSIAAKNPKEDEVKGMGYGAGIDFALVPLLQEKGVSLNQFIVYGVTPETIEQLSDRDSKLSKFMEKKGLWTRPPKQTRQAA